MNIYEVKENKKQYMSLLLLGDEQADMIDKYIDLGTMYVLDNQGIKGEYVVEDKGKGIPEIKNLAVDLQYQGKGYGKSLIDFLVENYKGKYTSLQVGTGDSSLTVPFYEKCGFERFDVVKNFFVDYYDHPIYENGIQLKDMIYLQRKIGEVGYKNEQDTE